MIDLMIGEDWIILGDGVVGVGLVLERLWNIVIILDWWVFVWGSGDNFFIEVDFEIGDWIVIVGWVVGYGEECCWYCGLVLFGDGKLVMIDLDVNWFCRIDFVNGESVVFGFVLEWYGGYS